MEPGRRARSRARRPEGMAHGRRGRAGGLMSDDPERRRVPIGPRATPRALERMLSRATDADLRAAGGPVAARREPRRAAAPLRLAAAALSEQALATVALPG